MISSLMPISGTKDKKGLPGDVQHFEKNRFIRSANCIDELSVPVIVSNAGCEKFRKAAKSSDHVICVPNFEKESSKALVRLGKKNEKTLHNKKVHRLSNLFNGKNNSHERPEHVAMKLKTISAGEPLLSAAKPKKRKRPKKIDGKKSDHTTDVVHKALSDNNSSGAGNSGLTLIKSQVRCDSNDRKTLMYHNCSVQDPYKLHASNDQWNLHQISTTRQVGTARVRCLKKSRINQNNSKSIDACRHHKNKNRCSTRMLITAGENTSPISTCVERNNNVLGNTAYDVTDDGKINQRTRPVVNTFFNRHTPALQLKSHARANDVTRLKKRRRKKKCVGSHSNSCFDAFRFVRQEDDFRTHANTECNALAEKRCITDESYRNKRGKVTTKSSDEMSRSEEAAFISLPIHATQERNELSGSEVNELIVENDFQFVTFDTHSSFFRSSLPPSSDEMGHNLFTSFTRSYEDRTHHIGTDSSTARSYDDHTCHIGESSGAFRIQEDNTCHSLTSSSVADSQESYTRHFGTSNIARTRFVGSNSGINGSHEDRRHDVESSNSTIHSRENIACCSKANESRRPPSYEDISTRAVEGFKSENDYRPKQYNINDETSSIQRFVENHPALLSNVVSSGEIESFKNIAGRSLYAAKTEDKTCALPDENLILNRDNKCVDKGAVSEKSECPSENTFSGTAAGDNDASESHLLQPELCIKMDDERALVFSVKGTVHITPRKLIERTVRTRSLKSVLNYLYKSNFYSPIKRKRKRRLISTSEVSQRISPRNKKENESKRFCSHVSSVLPLRRFRLFGYKRQKHDFMQMIVKIMRYLFKHRSLNMLMREFLLKVANSLNKDLFSPRFAKLLKTGRRCRLSNKRKKPTTAHCCLSSSVEPKPKVKRTETNCTSYMKKDPSCTFKQNITEPIPSEYAGEYQTAFDISDECCHLSQKKTELTSVNMQATSQSADELFEPTPSEQRKENSPESGDFITAEADEISSVSYDECRQSYRNKLESRLSHNDSIKNQCFRDGCQSLASCTDVGTNKRGEQFQNGPSAHNNFKRKKFIREITDRVDIDGNEILRNERVRLCEKKRKIGRSEIKVCENRAFSQQYSRPKETDMVRVNEMSLEEELCGVTKKRHKPCMKSTNNKEICADSKVNEVDPYVSLNQNYSNLLLQNNYGVTNLQSDCTFGELDASTSNCICAKSHTVHHTTEQFSVTNDNKATRVESLSVEKGLNRESVAEIKACVSTTESPSSARVFSTDGIQIKTEDYHVTDVTKTVPLHDILQRISDEKPDLKTEVFADSHTLLLRPSTECFAFSNRQGLVLTNTALITPSLRSESVNLTDAFENKVEVDEAFQHNEIKMAAGCNVVHDSDDVAEIKKDGDNLNNLMPGANSASSSHNAIKGLITIEKSDPSEHNLTTGANEDGNECSLDNCIQEDYNVNDTKPSLICNSNEAEIICIKDSADRKDLILRDKLDTTTAKTIKQRRKRGELGLLRDSNIININTDDTSDSMRITRSRSKNNRCCTTHISDAVISESPDLPMRDDASSACSAKANHTKVLPQAEIKENSDEAPAINASSSFLISEHKNRLLSSSSQTQGDSEKKFKCNFLGTLRGEDVEALKSVAIRIAEESCKRFIFLDKEDLVELEKCGKAASVTEKLKKTVNCLHELKRPANQEVPTQTMTIIIDAKNSGDAKSEVAITISGSELISFLFGDCPSFFRTSAATAIKHDQVKYRSVKRINTKPLTKEEAFRKAVLTMMKKRRRLKHLKFELAIRTPTVGKFKSLASFPITCLIVFKGYLYVTDISGNLFTHNIGSRLPHRPCCRRFPPGSTHSVVISYYRSYEVAIFTGGFDGTIRIFSRRSGYLKAEVNVGAPIHCFIFKFTYMLVGLSTGEVAIFSKRKLCLVYVAKLCDSIISSLTGCYLNYGVKVLIAGSYDGLIYLFDVDNKKKIKALKGHHKAPRSLLVDAQKLWLYSCSADKVVIVHNIETSEIVYTFREHTDMVTCISINTSLNVMVTSCFDGIIRCFNLHDFKLKLQYHNDEDKKIMCLRLKDKFIYFGTETGQLECIAYDPDSAVTCKFGSCEQKFGRTSDLISHLNRFHFVRGRPVMRCLWNKCDAWIKADDFENHFIGHLSSDKLVEETL